MPLVQVHLDVPLLFQQVKAPPCHMNLAYIGFQDKLGDMKVRLIATSSYRQIDIRLIGIGEVIEQGPGVTKPVIGSKVGIKWAAEVCINCGT